MDTNQIAIRGTTQDHLDIEDIKDDLVILKDGSCCLIIATTAINFELLSEREQEATIYAYAGLLNSLTFAIQIIIRSQRKDISSYVRLLETAEQKEAKPEIKAQIQRYRRFVEEIVQKNEVLDKKAYVVIPMSSLELGVAKSLTAPFRSRKKLPFEKDYILEKAKMNLYPRRDHLIRLLARLGLKGRQLTTQELIQLFFTIYNPEAAGQQIGSDEQYQVPLVQTPPEGLFPTPAIRPAPTPPPTPIPETASTPASPKVETSTEGGPIPPVQAPVSSFKPAEPPKPKEETLQSQISDLVKEAVTSPASPDVSQSEPIDNFGQ